jgi:broad specificity phosphatase PhoE
LARQNGGCWYLFRLDRIVFFDKYKIMEETKIYLVRHGESEGNKENKMRGRHDFPLTEEGERQAKALALVSKEWDLSAIFTSPLIRARKTAEYIGGECGFTSEIDMGFHNIKLGEWEGKSKQWIAENFPEEWRSWKTNPEELVFPGFEPLSQVQNRAYEALVKRTEEFKGRNFCIVTHRAIIKPLIAKVLEIKSPYYWKVRMATASYSRIVFDGNIYYLDLFNEVKHLAKEYK